MAAIPAPNGGSSRDSTIGPLVPLEILQNQRRGSITDPSLHATPRQSVNPHFFRPEKADPRPASPYVFGSATHDNPQLRKLLRSPSPDNPPASSSRIRSDSFRPSGADAMNVDGRNEFDYSMRRHSIAVGHDRHTRSPSLLAAPHGLKRKMSADPTGFPTLGEESESRLSAMEVDQAAPAPKRRGSAIDTQRIAQLSLNDRRESIDSRPPQWWSNDRRDSTSSMFSNVSSVGGYSSSADSPHARPPPGIATFAWPSADHPTAPHRDIDQNIPVPPIPDRRMSVPDIRRPLRTHSRPPSRRKHSPENHSGPSSGQEDPAPASPTGSGRHSKESSATPYSRSPELRVSHKLAERKRRKEMKELFDELRDQLPADRGMKASKWEILSKAIDFVTQLKQSHQDMSREVDMLRRELDTLRSYQGRPMANNAPLSRPGSAQKTFSSVANGNTHRSD
ncbi:Transcription initiation factor [Mycena indigotica]|uniref:Transcription initiation factor n=1 Tax=Mycena indigotica TaxID=2126181 RepID=A0A8H6SMT6_9AGAR|nr:Transcription initiation factor [Mycena indigotica]KAF7301702.1 Transcription initiation factor [Mycena indigotica]